MKRFLLVAALSACTPVAPPEAPEPPPAPDSSHCEDSCAALQKLECKLGSDEICADFDDETGECVATKSCVEACKDDPATYPRDEITACP